MSITTIVHMFATSPWIVVAPAVVVLVIAIGGRTFIAGVRSALEKWVVDKIAARTGTRPDVASGLVNGIKSVPGVVRGNKWFVFILFNALVAVLIGLAVAHFEHTHPTPQISHSTSPTHS